MNYIFYDFETTGKISNWDQILQVGAIFTDSNFNEIDRFEARSSLKPGQIPYPKAILVNKSSINNLIQSNLSNFKLIKLMNEKFKSWGPAVYIGYNSIKFDEEFLRKSLFKNLFEPYLTVINGNKRADFLNILNTNYIFNPDIIKIPKNEKGAPVFKLDKVAPYNQIIFDAHDAIGDSIATLKLSNIIKNQNPELWTSSLLSGKREDANFILEKEKIVCITETFYGKTIPYVVSFLCYHPVYKTAMCFDLKHDPNDYINLSNETLRHFINKNPKIIRSVKTNKNPIILDKNYISSLKEYVHISSDELNKRSKIILSNEEFRNNIEQILINEAEEKKSNESQEDIYFEETIYKAFSTNNEKIIMQEFHDTNWSNKLSVADKFKEKRNYYFAEKIIFEENPNILSKDTYNKINRSIAKQIFSTNDEKWNTIPNAYKEIDDLRNEYENDENDENIKILNELNNLIEAIEKKFQDA